MARRGSTSLADICICCALPEEAEAVERVFRDEAAIVFKRRSEAGVSHLFGVLGGDITLSILLTWPADKGPVDTILHLYPTLTTWKPRYAFMTGICAGDKRDVALGDIIVARNAFFYDRGKVQVGKDGSKEFLPDTRTHSADRELIRWAQYFPPRIAIIEAVRRPISKHQQRDWLLEQILGKEGSRIAEIPRDELASHARA